MPRKSRATRLTPRARHLDALRAWLETHSWPRVQMALLVALTAVAGLAASLTLRPLGITAMWLRYPLAVLVAWLVFLGLLWVWLRFQSEDIAEDVAEHAVDQTFAVSEAAVERSTAELDTGGGDGDIDAGELTVVIVIALALLAGAFMVLNMVWAAPAFLAEILLDFALASGLWRRLKPAPGQDWLATAISRTTMPFLSLAVLLGLVGALLAAWVPGATSLGEVWSLRD